MTNPGTPTYEQLRTFLAVVDSGSFAAAGRQLNRAVSVVSYGIGNLEAQFGVLLFDREGTRKPRLTVAGQAVLAEARAIGEGFDSLRAKVKGLLDGLEAEVNLAVDVLMPADRLGAILRSFNVEFPTVSLRLHVEALGGVTALVLERKAVLGLSGPLSLARQDLENVAAGSLAMVPVAAPDHPLARMGKIPPGAGRDFIQLVLTDRSPLTEGRDFSVMSSRTWRLADLGAKHALLREGVGWGNMPLPMIESDLVSGALVRLAMPDQPGGIYRFAVIWRRDQPPVQPPRGFVSSSCNAVPKTSPSKALAMSKQDRGKGAKITCPGPRMELVVPHPEDQASYYRRSRCHCFAARLGETRGSLDAISTKHGQAGLIVSLA